MDWPAASADCNAAIEEGDVREEGGRRKTKNRGLVNLDGVGGPGVISGRFLVVRCRSRASWAQPRCSGRQTALSNAITLSLTAS
jgi:hypothetical protein